jgi:hypothetical protein
MSDLADAHSRPPFVDVVYPKNLVANLYWSKPVEFFDYHFTDCLGSVWNGEEHLPNSLW